MDDRVLEYSNGDKKFAAWLAQVDKLTTARLGVGLFDLPDMLTRDAFDEGVPPRDFFDETVMEMAREEGFDDSED